MEGQPLIERGEFGIYRSLNDPYRFNVYHMMTSKFVRGGFTLEGALQFVDKAIKGFGDIPELRVGLPTGMGGFSGMGMGSGGLFLHRERIPKDPYEKIPMIKKIMKEKGYI